MCHFRPRRKPQEAAERTQNRYPLTRCHLVSVWMCIQHVLSQGCFIYDIILQSQQKALKSTLQGTRPLWSSRLMSYHSHQVNLGKQVVIRWLRSQGGNAPTRFSTLQLASTPSHVLFCPFYVNNVIKLAYCQYHICEHHKENSLTMAQTQLYTAGLHYLAIALKGLSFISHLPCLYTGSHAWLKKVSYQALAQSCTGTAICCSYIRNYGTHNDHAVRKQNTDSVCRMLTAWSWIIRYLMIMINRKSSP